MNRFVQLASKSTFAWIVLFLLVANFLPAHLRPLAGVPHGKQQPLQLSKTALTFKMDRLRELRGAPDIMVIGSSLPMCALYYADGDPSKSLVELAKRDGVNFMQSYTDARHFQKLLSAVTKSTPRVFNFTGAALMASDVNLIVSRVAEAGKAPKTLVYCVGLRDFQDNINPPVGETPTFQTLCDANYLETNYAFLTNSKVFTDLVIGSIFPVYQVRADYRVLIEYLLCSQFNRRNTHQISMDLIDRQKQIDNSPPVKAPAGEATHEPVAAFSERSATKESTAQASSVIPAMTQPPADPPDQVGALPGDPEPLDYLQRYNPPNDKQLNVEMNHLTRMLTLCRDRGIKVVLVNMPVSEGNKRLSTKAQRRTYVSGLQQAAQATGAVFIDYESTNYPNSAFLDTAHLGGEGAQRFLSDLTASLAANKCL